jgi:prophage antirepressor-like protein
VFLFYQCYSLFLVRLLEKSDCVINQNNWHSFFITTSKMDIINFFAEKTGNNINVEWENGKPYYLASEFGKILGFKSITSVTQDFDETEKVVRSKLDPDGKEQKLLYFTEPGAYLLLMRSKKPIALEFLRWASQVVASIRKQGKYDIKSLQTQVPT